MTHPTDPLRRMDPRKVCDYRWTGPRPEVPDSSVRHVCAAYVDHDLPHRCGCGAETPHRIADVSTEETE